MILKILFASVLTLGTLGQYSHYTPSSNTYLLGFAKNFPLFSEFDLFDGPSSVSNAPTTTSTVTPTVEQIMYYNYYAISMYCTYALANLSCAYCLNYKKDVTVHTGNKFVN